MAKYWSHEAKRPCHLSIKCLVLNLTTGLVPRDQYLAIIIHINGRIHSDIKHGAPLYTLITRFIGPPWGPSRTNRTQVSPMLAPWTLLSGYRFERISAWQLMVSNRFSLTERYWKIPTGIENQNFYDATFVATCNTVGCLKDNSGTISDDKVVIMTTLGFQLIVT